MSKGGRAETSYLEKLGRLKYAVAPTREGVNARRDSLVGGGVAGPSVTDRCKPSRIASASLGYTNVVNKLN